MKFFITPHQLVSKQILAALLLSLLTLAGCSPGAQLLNKIPVHSVEVQVRDQHDEPIPGAQVEASNGRKTSTDQEGYAKVRFGTVGVHNITVLADNYMPSNFVVTMPAGNGKTFTPQLTGEVTFSGLTFGSVNMYPMMFTYLFSTYGYGLELTEYHPGDRTKWKVDTDGEALYMQKAFLKELENGKQWWQVALMKPEAEQAEYVAEVLFSKDRGSILRYREQIGDGEIQEKPVSEGWYTQPTELTEESVEGAHEANNLSIEVPAGSFTATRLNFGITQGASLKLWKVDKDVPGSVIKYETMSDDETVYESVLVDYGDDAQSMLNSF